MPGVLRANTAAALGLGSSEGRFSPAASTVSVFITRLASTSITSHYCKKQGHNHNACQALRCAVMEERASGEAAAAELRKLPTRETTTSTTRRGVSVAVRLPDVAVDRRGVRLPAVPKAITINILVAVYALDLWSSADRVPTS